VPTLSQFRRRGPAIAASLLMLAGLVVIGLTAGDYGVAWDDRVQTTYGELVLDYFQSGGRNRACNEFLDLRYYAPAFELPAAALGRLWPERIVELRHVLCALVALSSVPAFYLLGQILGRPWVGVWAAVLLLLAPAYYGQAFINAKDIPFATGFLWSMVLLTRLFARGRFGWGEIAATGAVIGLTMSVRPGGWLLLGPLYVVAAVASDWQSRRGNARAAKSRTLTKQLGLLAVAWTVMVLPWPWAHENPLVNPVAAIRMASKFHLVVPVLFEGTVYASDQLPRYYLAKYLLITTPLAMLLLAIVGLSAAARAAWQRMASPRTLVLVLLAAWLALPLVLFAVMRPNAYDGMRHFLFVVPAIAILAAIGLDALWRAWPQPVCRAGVSLAFAIALTTQVGSIAALHPYQMTYFNVLAGGPRVAAQNYDSDYWLTSYKEAIEWVERQPGRDDSRLTRVLIAANEHSQWCAAYFAGPNFVIETTLTSGQPGDLPPGCDYYIGTTRSRMSDNFPEARAVHEISRRGAVYTRIKQASRATEKAARPQLADTIGSASTKCGSEQ
jgi:hypothetical protein